MSYKLFLYIQEEGTREAERRATKDVEGEDNGGPQTARVAQKMLDLVKSRTSQVFDESNGQVRDNPLQKNYTKSLFLQVYIVHVVSILRTKLTTF